MGGDPSNHLHNMYRDPTNDYGAAWGPTRLILGALALLPGLAAAHPIDEVVQGAYLTLAPGLVQLEFDLAPGVEVAASVVAALDADGSGDATEAEAQAFGEALLALLTVTLDGEAVAWTLDEVTFTSLPMLASGNDVLKVTATAPRPDAEGTHELAFENRYDPAKSRVMANVFLRPGEDWAWTVTSQERSDDGRRYVVAFQAARL